MTILRSFDANRANYLINHPSVRPFVGAPELGELNLTDAVARPENWFLDSDFGGFILSWSAPGVHEVHTFILPEGRGKLARTAADEMIAFASEHGDRMLWTRVPPNLPHVTAFAVGRGMKPTGLTIDTFGKPYAVLSMEL